MRASQSISMSQDDIMTIKFILHSHMNQFRKTGELFHMHPIRMCESYIQSGGTDILIRQAILLHDTVEDSDRTIDDIENIFGKTIAKIVDGITCYDRMGRKLTKHETYQKFIEYSKQDYRCLIVKLFDCIDNLETLHGLLPEKQIIFKNEKRRVYLPIFIAMIDIVPHRYRAMYVEKVEVMRGLLVS